MKEIGLQLPWGVSDDKALQNLTLQKNREVKTVGKNIWRFRQLRFHTKASPSDIALLLTIDQVGKSLVPKKRQFDIQLQNMFMMNVRIFKFITSFSYIPSVYAQIYLTAQSLHSVMMNSLWILVKSYYVPANVSEFAYLQQW